MNNGNPKEIVFICGPLPIANILSMCMSSFGNRHIEKVGNRVELEKCLEDNNITVALAILINLYPAFGSDEELVGLIKDIRIKKMKFPLVALGIDKSKDPILGITGHRAYKLPAKLQEVKSQINSCRYLEDYELVTIIKEYCNPLLSLKENVARFINHDLPKLNNDNTKGAFFSNHLPTFKKQFMVAYNISKGSELQPLMDKVHHYIESSNEEMVASKETIKPVLLKIIDYCEGKR